MPINNKQRHAYLIIAHNNPYILEKILKLLDYENNDIYLHIDIKNKDIDQKKIEKIVKHGRIYIYSIFDVRWSHFSQIECELLLLRESTKEYHKYYHLISGVDIPLKSQQDIHDFFNKQEKEFIHFKNHDSINENLDRVNYYHFFTKNIRSKNVVIKLISNMLHKSIVYTQKICGINRHVEKSKCREGANWFSITHNLAKYIIDKEAMITKKYSFTYCADEMFLQSIVYNSSFYNNLYSYKNDDYDSIKRLIDWKRGTPYNYKLSDYEEIINSNMFFVRKVEDIELVDKIYKYINND